MHPFRLRYWCRCHQMLSLCVWEMPWLDDNEPHWVSTCSWTESPSRQAGVRQEGSDLEGGMQWSKQVTACQEERETPVFCPSSPPNAPPRPVQPIALKKTLQSVHPGSLQ